MIRENIFDEVHDCQETFRQLLDVISNPGRLAFISKQADKNGFEFPVLMTLAMTLLDNETSFDVVGNEQLAKTIADTTYSKRNKMNNAGFVFISKECNESEINQVLSNVFPGTLIEPHTSCTLIIELSDFSGEEIQIFKGPGIKDELEIKLPLYIKKWMEIRNAQEFEYPLGVDMYFVTPKGEIMAIPRKVKMEG